MSGVQCLGENKVLPGKRSLARPSFCLPHSYGSYRALLPCGHIRRTSGYLYTPSDNACDSLYAYNSRVTPVRCEALLEKLLELDDVEAVYTKCVGSVPSICMLSQSTLSRPLVIQTLSLIHI